MSTETTTLHGQVETIFYAGPKFTAGGLRTDCGQFARFAGPVFVRPSDAVRLEGRWVHHPKYGRQFEADRMGHNLEMSPEGLAHYLASHPKIKGIGPKKAEKIAAVFGREFDKAIRSNPEGIAAVAQVPLETIQALQRIWIGNADFNAAMTYLSAYELTHYQVTTLVEKFGSQVVPLLETDPYLLVREVPGFGFKRVDKIARKLNTDKELPSRIRAGLRACVTEALDEGHCWVEYGDLLDRAEALLVMDTLDSREIIERHLEAMLSAGALAQEVFEHLAVGLPEIVRMERDLAAILKGTATQRVECRDIEVLIDREGPLLNADQRQAVRNVFTHRISLMTGGAGSGKTYAVSTMVSIAEQLELTVALAAPTGKAAKRIEEVVRHEASTIHRLLGFNGYDYARDAFNPIEADLLIVDEVSMVDIPLAWHLFRAVDLKKTTVVLVGDHNQLPPVGPGNLLRDLVNTRAIPTTVLTQIIRQAGVLKENSIAILHGQVSPTAAGVSGHRRPWYVVDNLSEAGSVANVLLKLFDEVLQDRLGYDLIQDVQVLTPTHKGPLGTVELNNALQRLIQRKRYGVSAPLPEPNRRAALLPGDKVIQTKNDYTLGVMNGAQGVVAAVLDGGGLVVHFDGKPVTIAAGSHQLSHLQLAYATTIHKMQGSEFPCALIIVHRSHSFMHHRNLLYTAVTRAKESVILLGDRWGIDHCATKRQVDGRRTFLEFLLPEEIRL